MSKRRDRDYLGDIHEAMHRISRYTSGLTFEQFLKDAKTQDAVIRNLEVIGEATKKLTAHLRKSAHQIPWKDLAGVRDKLIHHYFGINYEIVWTIARKELPSLLPRIKELMDKQSGAQTK
ncbi:MAG: hypothetical protein A2151_02885 [Candidatus Muproteobacteria bacterium RBG_16_65_34]|uniref:DUF86 domain-containing protein n=1 Tax=Candidatus Muproteobacteria bacterium RBG_16_65_34 TaxID=1817760 RepID=A0A1F6TRC8_9PROT|nr:MAG: hypothetical protein A2151_02885 [Candidatus Muproteobacteria bacterium RBG_16_65_34]